MEMQSEMENPSCSDMEIDEEFEDDKSTSDTSSEKGDESKVIFPRENPLISNSAAADSLIHAPQSLSSESPEKRMYHRHGGGGGGRNQLGRSYHLAIISHNYDMAEGLVAVADAQTLNHMLCMTLDFVWFLNTRQDLCRITGLIKAIVRGGASDFMRAMLRTAFLASCVSAYQSNLVGSGEAGDVLSQKLKDRLKEYHGDDFLKAEASQKVQKFMEWALACISFHYRRTTGTTTRSPPITSAGSKLSPSGGGGGGACEVHLRLSAFKFFLDIAGDSLSGKDFTEAFDAACFPLTLFSSLFDPGWSSGAPAAVIRGLLGMLVEWGADNVNQCFLEASRFGSTELVRILLQIARDNSLDVDVDLALGFASHYCRIGTMECLVGEGNATSFLGPLMRAAERGCMTVVRWFVSRGCRDMELCLALTGAASAGKLEVVSYLLPHVPQSVLTTLSIEILKSAGERTNNASASSFEGVEFLLKSDFLRDPAATYAVANSIALSDDKSVVPALKEFLKENWSDTAFNDAVRSGEDHFLNLVRVYLRGESEILLRGLPPELVVAIGYLPLYRECVREGGELLSQKIRGHLVSAVRKLGNVEVVDSWSKGELMAVLARYLPRFLI